MKMMNLILGFLLLATPFVRAEDSPEEALKQLDRELIVERLRKAYAGVSFKLDGTWSVSNGAITESWTFQNQRWKCPNSQIGCEDHSPLCFKWFALGKSWLNASGPQKRSTFDFAGSSKGNLDRQTHATEGEEADTVLQFEGKRNALEVWEWKSPLNVDVELGISLRDYMIERIAKGSDKELLEWGTPTGGKGLNLLRVYLEKDGQGLLFAKK